VVTGLSEQEVQDEVDHFNAATSSPEATKVFLSAADKTSVSVTGPPARLKAAFLSSQKLRYSKHFPMPVFFGLCHAPHIYSQNHVEVIVLGSQPAFDHGREVRLPLFSPKTKEPFLADKVGGLFKEIITEILTAAISLDKLTAGIVDSLSMTSECRVLQFGSSIVSKGLLSELERELPQLPVAINDVLEWSTKEWLGASPSATRNAQACRGGYVVPSSRRRQRHRTLLEADGGVP
jgi:asperthecin polyketide synthase